MNTEVDHWPDEHVAWQGVIDAHPNMSVPFAVHVFIFHTLKQLQTACNDRKANGFSRTYPEPDDANRGAIILLAKPHLELSIVAHEATHITLHHHHTLEASRQGAKRWLLEHPESVAEMIGNMTAYIWYGIPEASELP